MATSAAPQPTPLNAWNERIHKYKQQRRFAYITARSTKYTAEDQDEAVRLLHGLRRDKCTVYTLAYERFLLQTKLMRSLESLKLMLLDIEAGLMDPVFPHDETTVCILIDEITVRQRSTATTAKNHQQPSSSHTKKPTAAATARKNIAPPPAKRRAVPLVTDFTFEDMIKHNIEALQYYMTSLMTTEDYMKFIFTNKDIEARFHRYINNILVHKSDGEKYLQLEEHINNRRILMDRLLQLPKDGQTFLLPDFNSRPVLSLAKISTAWFVVQDGVALSIVAQK